jgi:hydroxyacylglutathione hydrolase
MNQTIKTIKNRRNLEGKNMSDDKVKEVSKGIYQFKGISNFYLVLSQEIFIVDTGMPGKTNELETFLKNIKIDPKEIKTVVITHYHFDHTGSLNKIKEITGAQIAAHKDDSPYISGEKPQPNPIFMKLPIAILKIIYSLKPVNVDKILKDGDYVNDYKVIHTPGHTQGSICLYNSLNKVIFVGDNLSYAKGKLESPTGRLIPDMVSYKESMRKLGDLDIEVILTGHSPPVTENANKLLTEFLKEL